MLGQRMLFYCSGSYKLGNFIQEPRTTTHMSALLVRASPLRATLRAVPAARGGGCLAETQALFLSRPWSRCSEATADDRLQPGLRWHQHTHPQVLSLEHFLVEAHGKAEKVMSLRTGKLGRHKD